MKTRTKLEPHRFELRQLGYVDAYYIERIAELEQALAEQPRQIQIDIVGEGQILADTALLIRSILNQRSPKTRLITNARSSLCNGSVLVWLQGDIRLIRDDAKLFFRRVDASELSEVKLDEPCTDPESSFDNSPSEANAAEDEHARVLDAINEFLPVKEMAGRMIGVPVLRQFGLLDKTALDTLLDATIGRSIRSAKGAANVSKEKRARSRSKVVITEPNQN